MKERQNPAALWPTYALRAWLAALVSETRRAQLELDAKVEHYEKEIARLQKQKERSSKVIEALRESMETVDNLLRRVRDTEPDERDREHSAPKEEKEEPHRRPAGKRGR
jgi:hypothetical protein